jgi:DNA-binding NarL/FixJ family response regulator
MNMNRKITVLIADDHAVFRDGLISILEKDNQFEIVGEVDNGEKCIALVRHLNPDIVLMDIKMPSIDGIQATRIISDVYPKTQVIALSMYNEESFIVEMLDAGANGYILKSADKNEILEAIKSVYKGNCYYCKGISKNITNLIAENKNFNQEKKYVKTISFTDKELEIIHYLCLEFNSQEIAEKMNLSKRTIEGWRLRLQEKLHVKSTVGIVIYAVRKGIFIANNN